MTQRLMTAKEVSEVLGLSTTTLAIWRGKYPDRLRFIRLGRAIRYRPEVVEEFIQVHEAKGRAS